METTRVHPRVGAALVAVLLLAGVMELVAPSMASATSSFTFTRIAGSDRYATAASAAAGAFPSGADNAILANGAKEHFPDALAASYLAGSLAGPILLTTTDSLPSATDAALKSLKTKKVTIVGGTAAVSSSVETGLKNAGYTVARVAGPNRYDTAAAVAGTPTTAVGKDPDNKVTAIVASGANFPDALVSGPIGYASAFPVEITDPATLSPQTKQSLQNLKVTHVLITGGTTAVSTSTEDQIKALGITTTRFAGTNRSDTAAKVAAYATGTLKYSETTIDLARGDDPADSLGSAPYGGVKKTPLLLTQDSTTLGSDTGNYLGAHSGVLASGIIFGGTTAVSKAVEDEATSRGRGANQVTVAASPSSVKANGTDTSTITVTVKKADGTAIANDSLAFTKTGTPAAACGTVPASATTNASGQATVTYTASTTTGTCEVTATESQANATGKVTITQTTATTTNTVTVARPTSATTSSANTLVADGNSKESGITATVKDKNGAPVQGTQITWTTAGTCGGLSPTTSVTDSNGKSTPGVEYASSKTAGTCTITATESGTGGSGSTAISQSYVGVSAVKNSSTWTVTATVVNPNIASRPAYDGVTVAFTVSPSAGCGAVSPTSGTTGSNGTVTTTFTPSATAGICTITATGTKAAAGSDPAFSASGTTQITQVGNTLDLTAANNRQTIFISPDSVELTATVTKADGTTATGTVTFSLSQASTAGACGSLSSMKAGSSTGDTTTNDLSAGSTTATYTGGTKGGTCLVTAMVTVDGATLTDTLTMTTVGP